MYLYFTNRVHGNFMPCILNLHIYKMVRFFVCFECCYIYQLPSRMFSFLPIVSHSGGSVTGLVVGIIFVIALLVTVAVITLSIICK